MFSNETPKYSPRRRRIEQLHIPPGINSRKKKKKGVKKKKHNYAI